MGLENRQTGNYISILQGKICQRVPEGTPGAITRTNKLGKIVHEKFYESFTGSLIDIKVQDGTYGKTWNFHFRDAGEVYILQLSYSNSFATALLKQLPNVDLSKPFKVSPSVKEVEGKNRSSLFINQNGLVMKHKYTRANPNGLPDLKQVVVKGETVYDDTDRLVFLQNMVDTQILPKLKQVAPVATEESVEDLVGAVAGVDLSEEPFPSSPKTEEPEF